VEEPERHFLAGENRQRSSEMVKVPSVLGQGDQFLGERLEFLGFGQSCLDLAVFQERGREVAQQHPAMRGGPFEFSAGFLVTHGFE
jgi:hypothetical protein